MQAEAGLGDSTVDPPQYGLERWWAAAAAVFAGFTALGFAVGDPSIGFPLGTMAMLTLAWFRSRSLRRQLAAAFDQASHTGYLVLRVRIPDRKRLQLLWSQPHGVLRMHQGHTTITTDDGSITLAAANAEYTVGETSKFWYRGVQLLRDGHDPVTISFVGANDLAIHMGYVVDKLGANLVEQLRTAVPAPPAPASVMPASSPAGWYADPTQVARVRWWDGQQWTDHTTD